MSPKRKTSWLMLEWIGTVLFWLLPDVTAVNRLIAQVYYFFYNQYTFPNLRMPRTFNEKMITLKLSDEARSKIRQTITDKELVKEHVTQLVGPGHVVPTLAILRTRAEVDAFDFPLPCVIKPTHSSQEVMHLDTAQPTTKEQRILKYWLWKSYFAANREPNYRGLEHKLIVEPIIGKEFGAIEDVKILCFHGRPKLIQVDKNRFEGHRRCFYDIRGEYLPIAIRKAPAKFAFPFMGQLSRLLDLSECLSAGHTFLRVDCYVNGQDIFIGELTSFPSNCVAPIRPASADLLVARLFDEPDMDVTPALFGVIEDDQSLFQKHDVRDSYQSTPISDKSTRPVLTE